MNRRILCGTTALIAAGGFTMQADAASGLKLGITGFYRNSIGASFGNSLTNQYFALPKAAGGLGGPGVTTAGLGNFDYQTVSMRQEIRVNFTGKTTLDNGITVGVLVGLNGENVGKANSTTQINRAYADFSGKFGMVRIGEANSALQTDCVGDPGNVTANFGVNSPNESYSDVGKSVKRNQNIGSAVPKTIGVGPIGTIGTCLGIENKGNKVMYFSPSIDGFTFAASFAPQGGSRLPGGGLAYGTNIDSGKQNDVLSLGADYAHGFGDIKLTVGGGAEWAFQSLTPAGADRDNNPSMYTAGIQVGFGHFAVGASGAYYVNYALNQGKNGNAPPGSGYFHTTAATSDDGWVATAGVSYTMDAWAVGLQGMYGSYGQSCVAKVAGVCSVTGSNENLWAVSLNGAYALAPGISLEGQVAYTAADYGTTPGGVAVPLAAGTLVDASNVHSWEIDLGTAINF